MSKLDSGLLLFTPVEVNLSTLTEDAVRMFQGEAKSSDIDYTLRLEESYAQLNNQKVWLDPTRVTQVLIVSGTKGTHHLRMKQFDSLARTSLPTPSNSPVSRVDARSRSVSAYPWSSRSTTWTQCMETYRSWSRPRHRGLPNLYRRTGKRGGMYVSFPEPSTGAHGISFNDPKQRSTPSSQYKTLAAA